MPGIDHSIVMTPRAGWLVAIMIIFMPLIVLSQSRQHLLLNDNWSFLQGEQSVNFVFSDGFSGITVDLPHTWNNKDIQSGDKVNYGTAWYKKTFEHDIQENSQYFLRFEGAGQHATLFVNGKYVGEHLGSYSAFAFNITSFLDKEGSKILALRVNNELNLSYPKDNFLFGIFGGIYRNVELIITGDIHISVTDHASSGVYIYPETTDRNFARLSIKTLVENNGDRKQDVKVFNSLLNRDGDIVATESTGITIFPGGPTPVVGDLEISHPRFWNGLKDPYLYKLRTDVTIDGKVVDQITQNYGIRSFRIDPDTGFILNGETYRLYGVCRHQEWQDLGNALKPEHHRTDMELIREIGASSIRLAHYQQAEYIYALADSIGFLVWAEIPFVNGYLEGADGNALQQMTELIKQNFNHPSIFTWGVHNEVIKGEEVNRPVNLTRELHLLSKDLDPFRYTVSVSNIWWVYDHPVHENTDLQGFNQYTGWYGGKVEDLGRWIDKYRTSRPDVRFSISEYGAGANIAHQSMNDTTVPDPTGQFFPEGYQVHYHETAWAAIARSPFIWASYIWNMFDFSVPEWDRGGIRGRNHKGLVTYDRKVKKDAFYWYKANWSEEEVLYLQGRRNDTIVRSQLQFKAYCNFGVPEFFVDGISLGLMKPGINHVQFVSETLDLEPGSHLIEITADHNEMRCRDAFELFIKK